MQRLTASLQAGERLDNPFVQVQQQAAINKHPKADTLLLNILNSIIMNLTIIDSTIAAKGNGSKRQIQYRKWPEALCYI